MKDNSDKIILDLCGGTGSWSKPYRDAGYTVYNITLPEFDVTKWEVGLDIDNQEVNICFPGVSSVLQIPTKSIYGIIAAPPCTMFSLSRTTPKTPRNFVEGMLPVKSCMEIIWTVRATGGLKFWAVENPVGYLRQFLGNPLFTFSPIDFGERYTKRTDLWGYFKKPNKARKKVYLTEKEIHDLSLNIRKLPPIPEDYQRPEGMRPEQIRRSITSPKFAEAFYKANQ